MSAADYLAEAKANHPGGLSWEYNDGGRLEAGFRGNAGDCVTRSISIATGRDYLDLYKEFAVSNAAHWEGKAKRAKNPQRAKLYAGRAKITARNGIADAVFEPVLAEAGWVKTKLPNGSRLSDLPTDTMLVVHLRAHLVAINHGTIQDTFDSSYEYDRSAFAYWKKVQ